jgi:GGDEF domain-containing protein
MADLDSFKQINDTLARISHDRYSKKPPTLA